MIHFLCIGLKKNNSICIIVLIIIIIIIVIIIIVPFKFNPNFFYNGTTTTNKLDGAINQIEFNLKNLNGTCPFVLKLPFGYFKFS